jgi:predicted Zn-dependent peptidase
MNRLGSSVLSDLPLLSIDEAVAKIDAVTAEGVAELARELWAPEGLSLACIGPDEDVFRRAAEPLAAGAVVS